MPQIELADRDLEKVDELVKNGIFHSRESAVKGILESISDLSLEEIKKMEKAKQKASMFLEIYMGILLHPITAMKTLIEGREMYKISVKSELDQHSIFGYVYIDAQTLEVNIDLSIDWESLPETSNEKLEELKQIRILAENYCKTHLDNMHVGAPRKVTIEDKEYFEVHVKRNEESKTYIYGALFIDAETLAVEEMIYRSEERVHEIDEMIRHDSAIL
ncbi:MAG: hypothetical protein HYW24_04980 [Candidatus Aenigmarchaeota archaeon]|nr:hypothetical protein [Candidatus Aenigmarchaeota archaeon]